MNFVDQRNFSKSFIIIAALTILALILWNTTLFYNRLKTDERFKMEIFAQSTKALNSGNENDYLVLNFLITDSNSTIPIIVTDADDNITLNKNTPYSLKEDPEKLKEYFNTIRKDNLPIEITLGASHKQYMYYGSSPVLKKLRFYPIVIVLIIILLIGVVFFFFTTTKTSEQNKLWAGMAKETAHQIGTPLSSLVGWSEILKMENVNPEYLVEINKDISRLKMITERFSKIGSIPHLEKLDIVEQTKLAYEYLEARSSKLINFSIDMPQKEIPVYLNEQLFGWTIENIVKNAIDAMRGKGDLHLTLLDEPKQIHINITDTGKGILKSKFSKIFEPGYTSKRRGWGLGLSLARRIVMQYHVGRLRVLKSEIGKGTTFQITLRKADM